MSDMSQGKVLHTFINSRVPGKVDKNREAQYLLGNNMSFFPSQK